MLHKKALIIYLHWVLFCVIMQSKQAFCNLEIYEMTQNTDMDKLNKVQTAK